MASILFVCTANICRSPMAEALLRQRIEEAGASGQFTVGSAGTWTVDGKPPARRVHTVMQEYGIDIGRHRSRAVTPALLRSSDLIVVMTRDQQQALQLEFPDLASRIMCLSDFAGEQYDIPDPINGTLDDVREVAQEIDGLLTSGLPLILAQTSDRNA